MIRSFVTRLRIEAPLLLIREKWLDHLIAYVNPLAPAPLMSKLVIARANLTRPMPQRRTR